MVNLAFALLIGVIVSLLSLNRRSDTVTVSIQLFVIVSVTCFLLVRLIEYEIYFDETPGQYTSELLRSDGDLAPKKDRWGTLLKSSYSSNNDVNIASATSAGRDRIFGTRDDISSERQDINKSRIVGKWIGEKTKETASGFFGGLFGRSKHGN